MSNQDEPSYIQFSKVLLAKLKKFGIDVVMNHLSTLENKKEHEKKIERIIIARVCKSYNVTEQDIVREYVKDEASIARMVIIALLKKHTKCRLVDIAGIVGKTNPKSAHVIVSRSLKMFKELQPHIKHERIALDVFKEVDNYIQNHLNISLNDEICEEGQTKPAVE